MVQVRDIGQGDGHFQVLPVNVGQGGVEDVGRRRSWESSWRRWPARFSSWPAYWRRESRRRIGTGRKLMKIALDDGGAKQGGNGRGHA